MASPSVNKALKPRFKLWLATADGAGAVGDGRWELLKAVQREGSLAAATEALGISYRKAWGDLEKAEQALGFKLIEKHRGGARGGDTQLTQAGRDWVQAYGRFRVRVEEAIQEAFDSQLMLAVG
ncbi:MAG TPA: LysR family transcriptional regulator [Candidatus Hydrogenedentes bacterium]|nr:LysR family transcriptional regulator [Candidatus Hydrogenedentota bacterium]